MLTVKSNLPIFQAKPSCNKFAEYKLKSLEQFLSNNIEKIKHNSSAIRDLSEVTCSKASIIDGTVTKKVVSSEATKIYRTTSEKLAKQKAEKL